MPPSPRIEAAADRSELVRDALEAARATPTPARSATAAAACPTSSTRSQSPSCSPSTASARRCWRRRCCTTWSRRARPRSARSATRFGEPVAALVDALTDEEAIEPYERRKDEHRRQVEAAGADALAIYAADKLANIRALRRVYAERGRGGRRRAEGAAGRQGRGLGSRPRAAPPRRPRPALPQRAGGSAGGAAGGSERAARAPCGLNRRRSGSRYQSTTNIASAAALVTTVAMPPKRTSVISMIAPVIASARKPRPAIAKRLARKTRWRFCWRWKVSRW